MPGRRDIRRLQSEIDELFADLWQGSRYAGRRRAFRPNVDLLRGGDPQELTVVVELAGVDPDEVEIVATSRTLVLRGERRRAHARGSVYHRMEIDYGPFEREIELGCDVDTTATRATYRRGLLTIVLPVATRPTRPARVPIEVRRQA